MFVFPENLTCFVFLKHPFWDSPFCLITEIYLLLHFLFWNFQHLRGISGKYVLCLILLPYVKSSIYNMVDNNSNTSDNSEPDTELTEFIILKPFNMEPRKKSAIKTIHSTNINPRTFWINGGFLITASLNVVGFLSLWKQRKVCVAGTTPKFQKKIIMVTFLNSCTPNRIGCTFVHMKFSKQ